MERDAILLNEVGWRPLEVMRARGMVPDDYPPEWLPNQWEAVVWARVSPSGRGAGADSAWRSANAARERMRRRRRNRSSRSDRRKRRLI